MALYHGPTIGKTYNEFLSRANSKASLERRYHLHEISPNSVVKNALQSGVSTDKSNEAKYIEDTEQNLENINEGVTKDD